MYQHTPTLDTLLQGSSPTNLQLVSVQGYAMAMQSTWTTQAAVAQCVHATQTKTMAITKHLTTEPTMCADCLYAADPLWCSSPPPSPQNASPAPPHLDQSQVARSLMQSMHRTQRHNRTY